MAWKSNRNGKRPSVNRNAGEREAAGSTVPPRAEDRPESQDALSAGATQQIEHVDISLDEIRRARQASKQAEQNGVSTPDAQQAASQGSEGESAFDRDAEKPGKPLTSSQALVAFAAASAREVPAPKQKKKISPSVFGDVPVDAGQTAFTSEARESDSAGVSSDDPLAAADSSEVASAESSQAECEAHAENGKDTTDSAPSDPASSGDAEGVQEGVSPRVSSEDALASDAEIGNLANDEEGQSSDSQAPVLKFEDYSRDSWKARRDSSDASESENGKGAGGEGSGLSAVERFRASRKEAARKRKIRIGVTAGVLTLILAAAIFVAFFFFGTHLTGKIELQDEALSDVLVPVQEKGDPYYTLVAVEYSRTSRYYEGPGLLALVRVDPANKTVTVIDVPSCTQVSCTDSRYHDVSEAQVIGGDSYLVTSVAQLLNVDIAHFIRTDDTGLANIVNRVGGLEEDVPVAVAASEEGEVSVSKGKQTLDGASVVALTKALPDGEDPVTLQSANQLNTVSALIAKFVEAGGMDYVPTVGDLKNDFKTDMSSMQLKLALMSLRGEEGYKVYTAVLPGQTDTLSGDYEYLRDKTATRQMIDAVNATGDPNDEDESRIDKGSVFIEVQNGTTIEGAANDLRKRLRDKGWNVSFIGNNPYEDEPETLIIYGSEDMKDAAEAVRDDLGFGKVSAGEEDYSFGTDILVVVGLDWK